MTALRRCWALPHRLDYQSYVSSPFSCSRPSSASHSLPAAFVFPTAGRRTSSIVSTLPTAFSIHRTFHFAACRLPSSISSRSHLLSTQQQQQQHHHPTSAPNPTTLASPLFHSALPSLVRHFRKGRKGARTKLKSHSGSKKRFRFTRNGLIMRWRAGKSHKNIKKSGARLRRLSKPVEVYRGHVRMIRRSLPYGMKHSR